MITQVIMKFDKFQNMSYTSKVHKIMGKKEINMLKGILAFLCILVTFTQPSYADWFDDLWGSGGTYWWLRIGGDPPEGIIELDPESYYNSSHFEAYTLKINEYLKVEARSVGINIDTDSFTNEGYLRVYIEDSEYGSIGIYSSDGSPVDIINSGAIYAGSNNYAFGMMFENGISGSNIINSGNILSEITTGDYGETTGIYVNFLTESTITNSGSIASRVEISEVNEAEAYAYIIFANEVYGSNINNSGNLLSEVNLNNINNYAYGETYGIYSGYMEDSSIINSGNITSKLETNSTIGAEGYSYGIYFWGEGGISGGTITNDGNITSEVSLNGISDYAKAEAYGISVDNMQNTNITNSGNLTVRVNISEASQAEEYVFGMNYGNFSGGEIVNSGNINAEVNLMDIDEAYVGAYGVFLNNFESSSITNSGSVNVSLDAGNSNIKELYMLGINVSNSNTSTINNSGTINIFTTLSNTNVETFGVTGISVFGGDITVNNTGLIRLDVAGLGDTNENFGEGERIASGVLFDNTNALFSNTGRIYTSGNARALSIYNNSTVTLQNGFGYIFHGDPDIIKRPIYVDGTSILNLNNVPLYVYGVFSGSSQTVLGKPYFLIEKADGGIVEGTWGNLISMVSNPDINVNWYGDERGDGSAIIFNFRPQEAPSLTANIASLSSLFLAQSQFSNLLIENNIFGLLEEASTESKPLLYASIMSDVFKIKNQDGYYKNGLYLLPYYTRVNDSGLGADMNSIGFLMGFEKRFDKISTGIFGGYGRNDIDFTGRYRGNNEDQDVYSFGAYGIYNVKKWFTDLFGSYNKIQHKYKGWTGLNLDLRETDKYESNAFTVCTKAGLKFNIMDWDIHPLIGIRWTYWQTENHTTDVSDPSWRRRYSSIHENWFQFLSGIDISKRWILKNIGLIRFKAGLKLEQTLNDNEISVAQSLQGQRAISKKSIGDTSILGSISLAYRKDNFGIKFGFMNQNNSDYNAYSGYIQTTLMW